MPHSIFEIPGAKEVAVEFRSFSKTAGFTGLRCSYTVIPHTVTATSASGDRIPLHKLWLRHQSTKYNGTSYIVQRAAEAVYSAEGQAQIKETIAYYLANAITIRKGLEQKGFAVPEVSVRPSSG